MVFDTSLDLKLMKEIIGWGDKDFKDLFLDRDDKHYYESSVTVFSPIRDNKKRKDSLPFRLNYYCETTMDGFDEAIKQIGKYLINFSHYILDINFLDAKRLEPKLIPLLSESISNSINASGKHKDKFLKIELYHPKDPIKSILRINSPKAKPWDYKSHIEKYLKHIKNGGSYKEGLGRGGFSTFNSKEGVTVSYDNKGKDFLALIDFKPILDRLQQS